MALALSGPLTMFLCDSEPLTRPKAEAVWADAFALDWPGDLRLLPASPLRASDCFWPFWRMRTRGMYARVLALGHNFLMDGLTQAAIANGWLGLIDMSKPKYVSLQAAACGDIAVISLLHEQRRVVELEEEHAIQAAQCGHVGLLVWLGDRMVDGFWTVEVMDMAAEHGQLECIKWLHTNRTEGCSAWAMNSAARNGHLDVVEYLHQQQLGQITPEAMRLAAEEGNLSVVEFMRRKCPDCSMESAAEGAASSGQLKVLHWIYRTEPSAITPAAVGAAIGKGHAQVVTWMAESTNLFSR